MDVVTLAAFDDELIKIAYTREQLVDMGRDGLGFNKERAEQYAEQHKHLITGTKNPQQLSSPVGTTGGATPQPTKRHLAPPVEGSTGVVAYNRPATSTGLTGTHVRSGTTASHIPAATAHPAAVPGGLGKMVGRGTAALKAHAVPLAVGAGVATAGALALNHMRRKHDAASR